MRRRGTGTIQKTVDGRFRPRMPGTRVWLDAQPTYAEAERLLDAAISEAKEGRIEEPSGLTLADFGRDVLRDREHDGRVRDVASERSRFETHVATSPIGRMRLKAITEPHVREWLAGMLRKNAARGHNHKHLSRRKLSRTTISNTLAVLRAVFEAAVVARKVKRNPARDVELPREEGRTHDPWTYLTLSEQEALTSCTAIPLRDRLAIMFAIGSGLRQGEQWNLELRDVHLDGSSPHVVVRYGSSRQTTSQSKRATKAGRIRRVPLFGLSLRALQEWLPLLKHESNPHALAWPSERGCRRGKKPLRGWSRILELAGLEPARRHDGRPVRWHDLRHTCASVLGEYAS